MKQTAHEACLLLGSNIRPEDNIPLAVDLLQKQTKLLQASSIWEDWIAPTWRSSDTRGAR